MSRLRVSSLAQSDLDSIWVHVAQEASLETADWLVDEIVDRFVLLSRHPAAGRLREDIAGLLFEVLALMRVGYSLHGRARAELGVSDVREELVIVIRGAASPSGRAVSRGVAGRHNHHDQQRGD